MDWIVYFFIFSIPKKEFSFGRLFFKFILIIRSNLEAPHEICWTIFDHDRNHHPFQMFLLKRQNQWLAQLDPSKKIVDPFKTISDRFIEVITSPQQAILCKQVHTVLTTSCTAHEQAHVNVFQMCFRKTALGLDQVEGLKHIFSCLLFNFLKPKTDLVSSI